MRIIPILILHTTRCCAIIDLLYKIYAFKELKVTLPNKGEVVTQDGFMKAMKELQEKYKEMMGSGVDTK